MKIVIPGGSGQVGAVLARAFVADGHEVVVLSRNPVKAPWRMVQWDAETVGAWSAEVGGADVVINLAGRSVNCRYNAKNRRLILDSRVHSTRAVGKAIAQAARPPRVWLQASTATIYAHRFDAPNDEATGVLGGSEASAPEKWQFSIDVAKAWEQAALEAVVPRTRLLLLRSAMTMSPDRGGIFDVLLGLVRKGLGGKSGNGRQYVSWIHDQDFIRAIYWLIDHEEFHGPVNLASPNPVPNAEFMRSLRAAWGIRLGLPAAKWMLALGAFFLRTETELVLKSRRVVPGRLLQSGFEFRFSTWAQAAADLCRRWRELRPT
ncbi:MAG: TIGR01777 family oxidoreductase [Gemmataceae bacterium]|nr:TIGR01777 family oxidoreductase [Gemmataceae bacterium]MCI0742692.1 TIGR01777 family oxidoreductase [Gemmataceae bacterium]